MSWSTGTSPLRRTNFPSKAFPPPGRQNPQHQHHGRCREWQVAAIAPAAAQFSSQFSRGNRILVCPRISAIRSICTVSRIARDCSVRSITRLCTGVGICRVRITGVRVRRVRVRFSGIRVTGVRVPRIAGSGRVRSIARLTCIVPSRPSRSTAKNNQNIEKGFQDPSKRDTTLVESVANRTSSG